jgi:hypothetical protein
LREADLSEADLCEAVLREADLSGADLSGADLSEAYLMGADLSGAIVDEKTIDSIRNSDRPVKGVQLAVNGIWVKDTDSAALMEVTPPGNSMRGANAEAVVESLKHARRLHTVSMSLVLLGIGIRLSESPEGVSVPFIEGLTFSHDHFSLLAMCISFGILSLVVSFTTDAYTGARYLQTRRDAMTVGTFPWALSRYAGAETTSKFQSLITRLLLAFHPLAYAVLWDWEKLTGPGPWYHVAPWHDWTLLITLGLLSWWTFVISQRFQRPILFDRKTEQNRKSDIEALTEAVERQTATIEKVTKRFTSNH